MNLQKFTTKLQTICHNGYSQNDIFINIDGVTIPIKSILIKTDDIGTTILIMGDEEKDNEKI